MQHANGSERLSYEPPEPVRWRSRARRLIVEEGDLGRGKVERMPDPLKETAEGLVHSHLEVEPNLRRVFFYRDPDGREIRLMEVVDGSPSAEDVLAFRFAPDEARGVRYPVVIVELSPDEFDRLERGELTLPVGWTDREELYAA